MSQEVASNNTSSSSSSFSSSSSQEEDDSFIPSPVVTRVVTLSATNHDTETTNHTNDNNNNNSNILTANPSSFVSSSSSSSVSSSVSSSAYPYEDGTLEMDTPSDTTPNTTTCIIEHSHPTTIGQGDISNNDIDDIINNNNHHSLMELAQYSYMDNYVKMVFTILGVGMLLPWNAFVSADNYFETRLCSSNTDSDSDSGSNGDNGSDDGGEGGIGEDENDKDDSSMSSNGNFMLWMGLIYNLSNVLTLGILLYIQKQRRRRRAWKKHLSRTTTMMTATTTNTNTTTGGGIDGEEQGQDGHEEDFHMNDACSLHTTPIRVQDVLEVDAGMTLFQDDDDDDEAQQPRGNTTLTLQEIEIQKAQRQQRRMILLPFVIILVILTMTTIIVTISDISPFLFLLVTLVGTFLCGSSSAFISAGIVSFSSLFASHVGIQPFISGQALGGTLISILNMIFTAMTSHSIDPFWEEHCQQEGVVDSMDSSRETMMSPISSPTSSSSFIISNQMSTSTLDGRILQEDNDGIGCAEYLIDWGAFNYFAISAIFTVLCLYLYNNLDRQPQTNIRRAIANQGSDDDDDGIPTATTTTLQRQQQQEDQVESLEQMRRTALFGDESIWTSNWTSEEAEISGGSGGVTQHHFISNSASNGMGRSSSEESRSYQSINPPDGGGGVPTKHAMTMSDDNDDVGEVEEVVTNLTSFVWSRVRLPALSIFFIFFVTLSIFPAYWTTIQSVKQCQVKEDRWTNDLFVIMSIVFYNVADLAGRMCTSSVNTHTHRFPQKLLFWSVVRFLSFPLFLLCNTGGGGGSDGEDFLPLMNLFHTDLYSRLLMLVFGFTNGFISSLAFTCAPALIPSKEEYQTVASTILNFALGIGLLGGSLFSFVYIRFASGDW